MNQELLERLARESGCDIVHDSEDGSVVGIYATPSVSDLEDIKPVLQRFGILIAEECAKLCEAERDGAFRTAWHQGLKHGASVCAAAIRKRFKA
jgi:hypothetical protein